MKRLHFATAALSLAACLSCLAGYETWLRQTGQYESYYERTRWTPASEASMFMSAPWLYTFKPGQVIPYESSEFQRKLKANSLGLPDREHALQKAPGEFRVAFVGDSFTAGVGATEGNGYVDEAARQLARRHPRRKVTALNGGVSGSDQVYGLEVIERLLLRLAPDLVVMTINSSDIDDLVRRGGRERFDERGSLVLHRPWFSGLFQRFRAVRALLIGALGYDWELLSPGERRVREHKAIETLVECGKRLRELARRGGFKYALVLHPYPNDLTHDDYTVPALLVARSRLEAEELVTIDLRPRLKSQIPAARLASYFWPIDAHFNDAGYRVFGRALVEELESQNLVPGR